ncbi:hypothetical protein P2G88_06260 [Aliiglaciecola sp. CAU 1673]|uniref:hypothetical protein n=1 Tax=Aliiglaciecola sp. CAU 1673 TaxID=3032595 RepID=UPI0023DA00D9|nr:hypothetical protein [Aliiglaciecola sp. CAU 1673]MDF2177849.1 hypothetical protein [Aliiglaciecola sp. CAU 1673]
MADLMGLEIDAKYNAAQEYVHAVFKGLARPEDIVSAYHSLQELADQHHCNKLLVDGTGLELDYDSAALMAVMHSLKRLFSKFRIARVVKLSQYKQDLIEGIATSAGHHLKNFAHEKEAIDWLLERE